jgi:Armadillo/beta-catenin-like repeat
MAKEGGIEMLIHLLESDNELILRQSAKALANLGVNANNKRDIALKGGIPKLVRVAGVPQVTVKIEAVAALANLAVNGKKMKVFTHSS